MLLSDLPTKILLDIQEHLEPKEYFRWTLGCKRFHSLCLPLTFKQPPILKFIKQAPTCVLESYRFKIDKQELGDIYHACVRRGLTKLTHQTLELLDLSSMHSQWTFIKYAVVYQHYDALERLLERGIDVNITNPNGDNLLHLTVLFGESMCQKLLGFGIHVNHTNHQHISPLLAAVGQQEAAAVQIMLQHGADPNIPDDRGFSGLHEAAKTGNVQLCELLLDHGAHINAQDVNGSTPLHLSASFGMLETSMCLVLRGADLTLLDHHGRDAKSLAQVMGHQDILHLLESV